MATGIDARPARRSRSRRPYAIAFALLALLVTVAWFGQGRFQGVVPGTPAPDFAAWDLDGQPVRLSDYEDRVVLVNIWATWCAPCREEMPSMERLYREVRTWEGGEHFEILAVSVDATLALPDALGRGVRSSDLEAFASQMGLTYPIAHDPTGRIEDAFQTTGVPESFLVGRDGVIYRKFAGPTEWDAPQYQEQIRRLLVL